MWTSQRPGKRYAPLRSITSAFRVSADRVPSRTSPIRPRSFTTLPPRIGCSPTQSMMFALISTRRWWVIAPHVASRARAGNPGQIAATYQALTQSRVCGDDQLGGLGQVPRHVIRRSLAAESPDRLATGVDERGPTGRARACDNDIRVGSA